MLFGPVGYTPNRHGLISFIAEAATRRKFLSNELTNQFDCCLPQYAGALGVEDFVLPTSLDTSQENDLGAPFGAELLLTMSPAVPSHPESSPLRWS